MNFGVWNITFLILLLFVNSCSQRERRPASDHQFLGQEIERGEFLSAHEKTIALSLCYDLRSFRNSFFAHQLHQGLSEFQLQGQYQSCYGGSKDRVSDLQVSLTDNPERGLKLRSVVNTLENPLFPELLTDRSDFIMRELCSNVFQNRVIEKVWQIDNDHLVQINLNEDEQYYYLDFFIAKKYESFRTEQYFTSLHTHYKIVKSHPHLPKGLNSHIKQSRICEYPEGDPMAGSSLVVIETKEQQIY